MSSRIIAKFSDKRACPTCGAPVERLGETWHSDKDAEFYFTPRSVIARSLPPEMLPEYHPERWTKHEWTTVDTVDTGGRTYSKPKVHVQYEYLVDYLCDACNAVMQLRQTHEYAGPTLDHMVSHDGDVPVSIADSLRDLTVAMGRPF